MGDAGADSEYARGEGEGEEVGGDSGELFWQIIGWVLRLGS